MAITWPDIPNTEDNALHTYFTEMQTILKKTIDSMTTTSKDDISSQISSSISSAIPRGVIVAWSGAIVDIPSGWALCNGENDTPDFRDKFIIAAGGSYAVAATGGSSSATTAGTVGGTALTVAQLPVHSHVQQHRANASYAYPEGWDGAVNGNDSIWTGDLTLGASGYFQTGGSNNRTNFTSTMDAGSGSTHTHTLTMNSTSILPPYYALAWIMKL